MSEFNTDLASGVPADGLRAAAARLGLGAAGLWLILLIAGSVFVAVLIFSATQFQVRFANFVLYGGSLSIWKAEQLRAQWHDSRQSSGQAIEQAKKELSETKIRQTEATARRNQARKAALAARQEVNRTRRDLLVKIQKVDPVFARNLETAEYLRGEDFYNQINEKLETLKTKDPTISGDISAYNNARLDSQQKLLEFERANDEVESAAKVIEQAKEDLKAADENSRLVIPTSEGKPQLDEQQRAQIENAIYEFDSMLSSGFGRLVHRLTLIPSDVLVLALVIVMGLLGSSLQLIHIYVNQFEQKSTGFYIIRPFFGVVTAFVVFIVAKAGIPLIADPSRVGTNTAINPYFISFLAIISGLLSERALVALVSVGSNYFRGSDAGEPPRWARVNLVEQFKQAHRDPDNLRKLLKTKDSEWSDWMQGKEPMPPNVQTMIAGVLEKPRRELFTDIPPDATEESRSPETEQQASGQQAGGHQPGGQRADGEQPDAERAGGQEEGGGKDPNRHHPA